MPLSHALLDKVESDEHEGLSVEESANRLETFGENRLREAEPTPAIVRFLRQFHDVLIYILIFAAIVTALLGEWIDTGVIAAVVLANAIIGFVQEGKAEEALASIRGMLSHSRIIFNI